MTREAARFPFPAGRALYDISVPISEAVPRWPGEHNRFSHTFALSKERGDKVTVSRLECGSHIGTHVDAPLHHLQGGASTDELGVLDLVGPATVVDLEAVEGHISAADLEVVGSMEARICLLKTTNSKLWDKSRFDPSYKALLPDAADWLAGQGVDVVGIDYLSIDPFDAPAPHAHRSLLMAGIWILEGLDLRKVPAGSYTMIALPISIVGSEAAPVRAVLVATDQTAGAEGARDPGSRGTPL